MIYETAIADAYAASWEFAKPGKEPVNDWTGYKRHPSRSDVPGSSYTDDTMRTMINAMVMLHGKAYDANAYIRVMKAVTGRDKRGGWSRNFRSFLDEQEGKSVEEWWNNRKPRNTNGALMGAAVLGYLNTELKAHKAGMIQAMTTHDSEATSYAGYLSSLAFLMRTNRTSPQTLARDLSRRFYVFRSEHMLNHDFHDPVDMTARMTFEAIVAVLGRNLSLRSIVDDAIALGGDTDSVAAACVGVASMCPHFYENDFPEWAYSDLERGNLVNQTILKRIDAELSVLISG